MQLHHISIRTADIFRAIAFYEQLGFSISTRFTTGTTLACWMEGAAGRIELIQIPEPAPAPDAFADPHYVGYYHLSFRVESIADTLASLGTVRILLAPTLQEIGDRTYRVAFIADPDGLAIEFLEEISVQANSDRSAVDIQAFPTDI
ncbi:VOC family protein [Synechococcus sp. PCC 7336]|uniref:VOC family protein n=1 Tax=Synechococcus sp. PCC 7336 TaxID=195250 RepID=UPI0003450BEF|nr:VOC family protein [Synechococcus sp. PCC 7336]